MTRTNIKLCRPSGTPLINLGYPALPCRAIGCSVPAGLVPLRQADLAYLTRDPGLAMILTGTAFLFHPGQNLQQRGQNHSNGSSPGGTAQPRSQKRDLGHPLKVKLQL
jgi:hypothetical protein